MCWRDDVPMNRRCISCGKRYYGDLGHRNCPARLPAGEREYRSWFPIRPSGVATDQPNRKDGNG